MLPIISFYGLFVTDLLCVEQAYLTSAGGGVACSKLGRIPTVAEYMEAVGVLRSEQ